MTRDLTWDAVVEVAVRLNQRTSDLEVKAARQWSLWKWEVVEGLEVRDDWTEVFEPVRRRRPFGRWQELQPVPRAASNVGSFLRKQPDLA
jgi:hypothetical protein